MSSPTTTSVEKPDVQGPATEALLASLARVVRPERPGTGRPIIQLPLPDLLIRSLVLASLLLIVGWCALLGWFSRDAVALAEGVRIRQEHRRLDEHPPLPTADQLATEDAFEAARQRHPGRGAELHAVRAEYRAANGDPSGAIEDFVAAQAEALVPLSDAHRLRWAACLMATGRTSEAVPLLWSLRLSQLDEAARIEAVQRLVDAGGHQGLRSASHH